ncbi:hypothetical protein KIN20_000742 [Parelaphostrongylus tenuis]|uniref:Hypoxia up-regulated protein 1 n=1 Tax=Parelaphostrongylus tenuis TaxID=148309 RepID=A0AAD5QG97_PARTN|nr:hypothetical protein KIN20_000742 [Parelaphostrongylus tenuis]
MIVGVQWPAMISVVVVLATVIIPTIDAAFGAMSIDMGSQFLKVGIIKPGMPMEIVLNKESQRKTPSVLSIRNDERLFGDAAQALATRYPANVYGHLLDLVAKHVDHPSVVLFRERFPHLKIEKHVNTSSVTFPIGDSTYSVETLLAMILTNVREFTEAYAEMAIRDVVISIPVFFTQAERLAIEKAAEISKLNLLQLINDGTAAGLNYGMFRRKEITDKPQRLLIYDMGSAKTVATIVEYKLEKAKHGKEPKMSVLGVGFDRRLGGLEMTLRLRDLLVKKFNENYKSQKDITTSERAMAKLFKEAERLKQVLSANLDYFAQIESVHEDIDMRVQVTRDEFNGLIEDLLTRVAPPIEQALKMAELPLEQIDQVVLMGAGTRVPKVQDELQRIIKGKELGRFLNTDESIAMGALYQAAHLSKGFKVKPFGVEELVIFPIEVSFVSKQKQENGDIIDKPITRHVFQFRSKYPTNKKVITFTSYTDDFSFDLAYSDLTHFNEQQKREFDSLIPRLNTISVFGVAKALEKELKPEKTEFAGVKVGFLVDSSGILRVEKAEAVIKRKTQGVVESIKKTITGFFSKKAEEGEATDSEEKKDEDVGESAVDVESPESIDKKLPGTDEKPSKDAVEEVDKKENKTEKPTDEKIKDETQSDMKNDSESTKDVKTGQETSPEQKAGNATSEAVAKDKAKTPEIVRVGLKIKQNYTTVHIMSKDDVKAAKKILEQFEKREHHARERAAAVNELESYAFEVSQLIEEDEYVKHSTEAERKSLQDEVKRVRNWLEDDVTLKTKVVEFTKNHVALKALVKPIKRRVDEAKTLPRAFNNLETMLNSSRIMASMGGTDENSLFNQTDAEAFGKKLDKLDTWLNEKKAEQAKRQPHEDPAVLTSEVTAKSKALDRELNAFMKKMKQTRIKDIEDLLKNDSKDSRDTKTGETKGANEANSEQTGSVQSNEEEKTKRDVKPSDDLTNETHNTGTKEEL